MSGKGEHMKRALKWGWPGLVLLGLLCVTVRGFEAQEPPAKKEARDLYIESLRDVINKGAKIFNENGDHAGCYRMFEGALVAVRPFVDADLQKEVERGLANAARMGSYADKAFELRRVIDLVRERTPSLWRRMGGEEKVLRIVDDFILLV